MSYLKIVSKFFVWYALKHGQKWTSICDKNGLSVSMGILGRDFITIFWIAKYLHRPIYI